MKLLFGADLVPTAKTESGFINREFNRVFGNVKSVVDKYDRLIVNLECALTNTNNPIKKNGPPIKASPLVAPALKEFGVTDVMLANNHVFDFGIEGLKDTVKALEEAGLPYSGIGENDQDSRKIYYIEQNGKKVAIINVCEHEYSYALPNRMGTNPYSPFDTMRDIKKAKENADFVVVVYHGGKEICRYPSPRLREHCREMVLSGASVVLTQHSHCIGCYEEYEGGHIVYGQGNFNFVLNSKYEEWYTSLLVGVDFTNGVKVDFYPIYQKDDGIDLATNERYDEIMDAFYKRNAQLKDGTWLQGWKDFCKRMEITYKYCMGEEYLKDFGKEKSDEVIAHYLECEAHLDVLKTLYTTWHLGEK